MKGLHGCIWHLFNEDDGEDGEHNLPRGNSKYQRLAYLEGQPGAKGTLHSHPGDEVLYCIHGRANVKIEGEDHFLSPGEAISIPPGTQHYPEVVGNEIWLAVAAYCDDCPRIAAAKK